MKRLHWFEIFVPIALLIVQAFIALGMLALNWRFEVVEAKISGVEKRLEDHMHPAQAQHKASPAAVALVSPTLAK